MLTDEQRKKIKSMWDDAFDNPEAFLKMLWRAQTHCFTCNAEVPWDGEVCEKCGQELLENGKH